jgi:ethanolamine utilization protein EutQ (cupin superfamily)
MGVRRVPAEKIVLKPITEGMWKGTNINEIFPSTGDTDMSAGIHEIFKGEYVVEKAPVADVLHILEGEIEIEADGVTETFGPGDFAYLTIGVPQKYTVSDRVKLVYVTYPANWTSE